MKITGLDIWPVRIPYLKPYTTSQGTISQGEGVIIAVHTDEGLTGIGETSFIFPDRSGETVETVPLILQQRLGPALLGKDPFDTEGIMHALDACACEEHSFPYSKAAIDLALLDLMGKALQLPVAKLIGGIHRDAMEVGRSMSIKPVDELVADAEKLRNEGYKLLTLKGSRDWQTDVQRFIAVRKAVGPDFPLEIDANQAYNVKNAIRLIQELEPYELANLEQPCEWWNLEGMAQITSASTVPITADESVSNSVDVSNVVKLRAADMVTIKLARVGGIRGAQNMVAVAEAGGLYCNMGSKHTFGVGTAAIIHFCAAQNRVIEPLGYGSPLERFVDDVIIEAIPFSDGIVKLPEGPGLGVSLDMKKLGKYSNHQRISVSN